MIDKERKDNRFQLHEKKSIMEHISAREWDLSYSPVRTFIMRPLVRA